ncbi:hypothetical protein ACIGZJ_31150 [Kitasatospora sp. NPDC052868]|uniref:hypothetical protein n=1 Tax=Kitasatospora sp. NPDC052868 TaxID=3364060 RepID=UPI0037CA63F2
MTDEDELARLRADVVKVQRRWFEAEAFWVAEPEDPARYEAFAAVGLELHGHAFWQAAGGNRFERETSVRKDAREEQDGA